MSHESHASVVNRLKRAEGHLRKIIMMIEEERSCVDVAQQLHAVEKAVTQAKKLFIRDHIDHCLDGAVDRSKNAEVLIGEFKEMSKYL